ncbi:MAG: hypothetical protein WBV93_18870 [Anaerobacillus sp.]
MVTIPYTTSDVIALLISWALCFLVYIYREKLKEKKAEVQKLKKENVKLKEAVDYYHNRLNTKRD